MDVHQVEVEEEGLLAFLEEGPRGIEDLVGLARGLLLRPQSTAFDFDELVEPLSEPVLWRELWVRYDRGGRVSRVGHRFGKDRE